MMGNVALKHTQVEKQASLTTHYTIQKFKSCIGSRTKHCRTVLQNGRSKPRKHLPRSNYHRKLARTSSRYQAYEIRDMMYAKRTPFVVKQECVLSTILSIICKINSTISRVQLLIY